MLTIKPIAPLENLKAFHNAIVLWYANYGRKHLPWRNFARDGSKAYEVYISEIMLQQTQVARVLDMYYFPFLERFKDLNSLAQASQEEVLLMWQGLGFYSRAHKLHSTAKICAEVYSGYLPSTYDTLLALPGIGTYTAGAVLCFGFGKLAWFADSNIKRLISRIFGHTHLKERDLGALTKALLNREDSFTYNQALIDLGALICTPVPKCTFCPINEFCVSKDTLPEPHKKAQNKREKRILHLLLLIQNETIALIKSSDNLYKGLYNLPHIKPEQTTSLQCIGTFKHAYTKYNITAYVWCPKHYKQALHLIESARFYALDMLPPISNLTKKALCHIRV